MKDEGKIYLSGLIAVSEYELDDDVKDKRTEFIKFFSIFLFFFCIPAYRFQYLLKVLYTMAKLCMLQTNTGQYRLFVQYVLSVSDFG